MLQPVLLIEIYLSSHSVTVMSERLPFILSRRSLTLNICLVRCSAIMVFASVATCFASFSSVPKLWKRPDSGCLYCQYTFPVRLSNLQYKLGIEILWDRGLAAISDYPLEFWVCVYWELRFCKRSYKTGISVNHPVATNFYSGGAIIFPCAYFFRTRSLGAKSPNSSLAQSCKVISRDICPPLSCWGSLWPIYLTWY